MDELEEHYSYFIDWIKKASASVLQGQHPGAPFAAWATAVCAAAASPEMKYELNLLDAAQSRPEGVPNLLSNELQAFAEAAADYPFATIQDPRIKKFFVDAAVTILGSISAIFANLPPWAKAVIEAVKELAKILKHALSLS